MLSVLTPTQQHAGYPLTTNTMDYLRHTTSPMDILRHNGDINRTGMYRLDSVTSTQSEDSCSSSSTYDHEYDVKQNNNNNSVFTSSQGKIHFHFFIIRVLTSKPVL